MWDSMDEYADCMSSLSAQGMEEGSTGCCLPWSQTSSGVSSFGFWGRYNVAEQRPAGDSADAEGEALRWCFVQFCVSMIKHLVSFMYKRFILTAGLGGSKLQSNDFIALNLQ